MSFKIKAVRRDLGKFSGPVRYPIMLNLKTLSGCCGERGAGSQHATLSYVQSLNVIENK